MARATVVVPTDEHGGSAEHRATPAGYIHCHVNRVMIAN